MLLHCLAMTNELDLERQMIVLQPLITAETEPIGCIWHSRKKRTTESSLTSQQRSFYEYEVWSSPLPYSLVIEVGVAYKVLRDVYCAALL